MLIDALRWAKQEVMLAKDSIAMHQLLADWRRLRGQVSGAPRPGRIQRLILIPSDPDTLIGSKGDEAMLQACRSELERDAPERAFAVLVGTPEAAQTARQFGWQPLQFWNLDLGELLAAVLRFQPDALLTLGADIMDGFYSPLLAARRLVLADLLSRRGIRASVLGFSFNRRPARELIRLFDAVGSSVTFNVRDSVSLARFSAQSHAPARLVADVAFLLRPDSASRSVLGVREWVRRQHECGRTVLGFNVHPMLFSRSARSRELPRLIENAAAVLAKLLQRTKLSIVLTPHDYRGKHGDDECLRPLHAALRPLYGERLLYPNQPLSAAELKGLVGELDGVVTGRMHLAIAALGMGVPAAGIAYQDKFQGLFQHFGLSERLVLQVSDALRPEPLTAALNEFIDELPELRRQVGARLEGVRGAALQNLAGFN
jgi:polysaccharide pyruvyl transferase WcaK-like protein